MLEIELKYLNADFGILRAKLRQLNAICLGSHFERNLLFDTADMELFHKGQILRVRTKEWQDRAEAELTFKAPLEENGKSEDNDTRPKTREELELGISSAPMLAEIFRRLGYHQIAAYEKIREEWDATPSLNAPCRICLDELYFGNICEIEGSAVAIREAAKKLGLDACGASGASYHELHQEWLKNRGLDAKRDILFTDAQRIELRKRLGLP